MTRQRARELLEAKILELLKADVPDKDIAEQLGCALESVESVRHRHGMLRRSPNSNTYSTIDDYKLADEKKTIKGVKWEYKGHKYIDITGDIVDCGIAYKQRED